MSWEVRVAEPAERQILRIDTWWRKNREKAPELFAEEIGWVVGFLESSPLMGAQVSARRPHLRRMLLRGTRYHVYYWVDEPAAVVEIRAVWHATRGKTPRVG